MTQVIKESYHLYQSYCLSQQNTEYANHRDRQIIAETKSLS